MQSKALIAAAAAALLAAPLALAQYGSSSTTTPGATGMDKRSADDQTPPKSDRDKSATGGVKGGNGAGVRISASEFRKMDKNKDGFLSKDEVQGNTSLSSSFDQMDSNHDGKLALAEVSGTAGAPTAKRGADRISRSDSAATESPNLPREPQRPGNPPKTTGPN